MDSLDQLKGIIEARAEEMEDAAQKFRLDMLAILDDAKNNEILKEIKGLGARLSAIEERLPPVEAD